MNPDFGIFLRLLMLPMLILLPAVVWATMVIVVAVRIRRLSWIAAQPRLERPGAEDLSQGMRLLLSRLASGLGDAGFEPIESVHSPGFSGFGAWTQVLYVNPTTGERASFLNRAFAPNTGSLSLALATEYPPHHPVVTALPDGTLGVDEDFRAMLADLIVRHRDAVRRARADWQLDPSSGLPVGVAPDREDAIRWLQQRATVVAEAEAKRFSYRIDRSGDRYVAPWPLVFRVAAKRMLSRRPQPSAARGFDALPASPGGSAPTP